jgi:hypothetical protein
MYSRPFLLFVAITSDPDGDDKDHDADDTEFAELPSPEPTYQG